MGGRFVGLAHNENLDGPGRRLSELTKELYNFLLLRVVV